MVNLTHNIDALIAELEASKAEIEKGLMPFVMQPDKYKEQLKADTRRVLESFCEKEEYQYIDDIVNAVTGYALGSGMVFQVALTNDPNATGPADPDNFDISKFEADVVAWVAEQKIKDERDKYKGGRNSTHEPGEPMSDLTIARRIMAIIKHEEGPSFFATDTPDAGANNPTGLWQALQKNPEIGQGPGLTTLGEDRCVELMQRVLAFWQEVIGIRIVGEAMTFLNQALDKPAAPK